MKLKKKNPLETQIYITCEDFVSEFINSIKKNNQKFFREKYRSAQLLIIDDIQYLSGKSVTQEELSSVLDCIADHGRQIILSSDCEIGKISGLSKRLKSRLMGGIVTVIQEPKFDDRREILKTDLLERNKIVKEDFKLTLYSVDSAEIDEITKQLDEIPKVTSATHWL